MSQAPQPAEARPSAKRHHGLVRLTHWLNTVVLLGLIGSGLRIYEAFPHFGWKGLLLPVPNPFDAAGFPRWAELGSSLAPALTWHFALAWPFLIGGAVYVIYLAASGEWRSLLFRPRDARPAFEMVRYYLRRRRDHPPQGKHNALQKASYSAIVLLGAASGLTGLALYKPVQLFWLQALLGGYELTRYWHFLAVWLFVVFTIGHVALVFLVDPASLRAMITGWYRGRFPSHG